MKTNGASRAKILLASAATILMAAATAQAQSGPVGYWKGDDGTTPSQAFNSVWSVYDGVYSGGATTSSSIPAAISAISTRSFSFNGTSSGVNIASVSWPSGGPVTVAYWNFVATATNSSAFTVGNQEAPNRFHAHSPWGDGYLYWDYGDYLATGRIRADYRPNLGKWTHVALVSEGNGGSFKAIYFDGVLAASDSSASAGPANSLSSLQIGSWTGDSLYHPGMIDDFRLYNRVLTPAQIALLAAGNTETTAPTGLSAVGGDTQISLSWNAASGATSYNLKRGTQQNGPYGTVINVPAGTTYTDTGLTNGTTYFYVVSALNGLGEGPRSNEANAIPKPPPGPPRTTIVGSGRDRCGVGSLPLVGGDALAWSLIVLVAVAVLGLRR